MGRSTVGLNGSDSHREREEKDRERERERERGEEDIDGGGGGGMIHAVKSQGVKKYKRQQKY